jgi:hypothetical protein
LAELAEHMDQPPYQDLRANLRKLASFRNKIRHSVPIKGDMFNRTKRAGGQNISIKLMEEELATYYNLGVALVSQLRFIPLYMEKNL